MAPPSRWWKKVSLPDTVQLHRLDKEFVAVGWDFIESSRKKYMHSISGQRECLEWLGAHLTAGYQGQPTSSRDLLCALYALEISLRPLYQLYNREAPNFDRLCAIHRSGEFRKIATQIFEKMWDACYPDMETRVKDQIRQDYQDLLNGNILGYQAILIILQILRQQDSLRIALGLINKAEDMFGRDHYSARIEDWAARKDPEDEDHDYHGIVWLVNDNAESEVPGAISHWSGVAPSYDLSPLDAYSCFLGPRRDSERERPQLPVRNRRPSVTALGSRGFTNFNPPAGSGFGTGPPLRPMAVFGTHRNDMRASTDRRSFDPFVNQRRLTNPAIDYGELPDADRDGFSAGKRKSSQDGGRERKRVFVGDIGQRSAPRRESHVMEEVQQDGWNTLTQEEQQYILMRHGFPPNARIHRFADVVHITTNLENLNFFGSRTCLYEDVSGEISPGHSELTERDPYNNPRGPIEHAQEMERGVALSRHPITNAPPWYKDLPWDQMHKITFEEFIAYFPNHVVRWPGLALYLRQQNWDRLFYRTARLINLARDSHYPNERAYQHIEVLPLMMKVQRAIQEFVPEYRLEDHHAYGIDQEWIDEHIYDKPRGFPENAQVVSLAEAAGYITGSNEFQDRPFSQSVRHLQQNAQRKPKNPFCPAPPARNPFAHPVAPPSKLQPRDRRTGWLGAEPEMTDQGELADDEGETPPPIVDLCADDPDCENLDCEFLHPSREKPTPPPHLERPPQQERKKAPPQQREREPFNAHKEHPFCRFGAKCKNRKHCRFLHPGDPAYNQARDHQARQQFSQASRSSPSHPPPQQHQPRQNQNQHPQPQPQRNAQHTPNEPLPTRQTLCRNTRCANPNCRFGHRSPAAPMDIHIRLDQWCRFGAACTNHRCDRSHASPTAAGRTAGKNGNGNGNGNHNDHGGGNKHKNGSGSGSGHAGQRGNGERRHGTGGPNNHAHGSGRGRDNGQQGDRSSGRGRDRSRQGGNGGGQKNGPGAPNGASQTHRRPQPSPSYDEEL
ncbi:hypothetical protein BU26DRAFT_578202 [Trematosphaeria pertusa]|uniref:C3H1-type domain-containing protein n=1 Tax=Trematosphaeria pertusa TaxID=390896 RepID=A0A6A6I7F3_9PLEO|nr:uncharacterized protein BU26DRAFT_578202 [Trematosphaeria pertusa]KAF2245440.1 hypothetical protein BU26DRAFT_578202 [Trematosphaeria pertusa]